MEIQVRYLLVVMMQVQELQLTLVTVNLDFLMGGLVGYLHG